jgi:tetratricopeptide (TPR) repeat protein
LALALVGAVFALVLLTGAGFYWSYRQQAQKRRHQAEVARAVEVDLREANEVRARAKSPDDPAWAQALAAARRAEGRLGDTGDELLRQRVEELLLRLAREQADQQMIRRLEDVRLLKVEMKGELISLVQAAAAYQDAFRGHGIEVTNLPVEEAAARLRASPIRAELAQALDDWAGLYSRPEDRKRLRAIARLGDPDPTRQALRQALEARDPQALLSLARSAQTPRLSATSLALLGRALVDIGQPRTAEEVLRQGQHRHPRDFWLTFQLGWLLSARQPSEAARFYTVALSLRPGAPAVLIELGNALSDAGTLDEAARCFEEAARAAPQMGLPRYNLGNVRAKQKRYAEAAAAYREVIRIHPDDARAHNSLGVMLLQLQRIDEGLASFTRAVKLKPDHAQAHLNIAMVYELLGDVDRAIGAFRKAAECSPQDPLPRLYLGRMLQSKGRLAEAVAVLRRADDLGAVTPGWGYPSGEWLAEAKRLLALESRLPALLEGKVSPASPEERLDWARLCLGKDRPARAAALYREAFEQKPELAQKPVGRRSEAARAAILAGFGQGLDGGKLDDKERAGWRNQALRWLRADLAHHAGSFAAQPPKNRRQVVLSLNHWQFDMALAGVRDPEKLKKLPAAERRQWRKFWDEVAALERKAAER